MLLEAAELITWEPAVAWSSPAQVQPRNAAEMEVAVPLSRLPGQASHLRRQIRRG